MKKYKKKKGKEMFFSRKEKASGDFSSQAYAKKEGLTISD